MKLFVNECLNFDVLEEKIVNGKNSIIKIRASPPPLHTSLMCIGGLQLSSAGLVLAVAES